MKIIAAIIVQLLYIGSITRVDAQITPPIIIKEIEIIGNTVFDSELEEIVNPLEGQQIRLEQILELNRKLTNYYISKGYTTSGAFFPPQKLTDGRIQIQIVEGTLVSIEIHGLNNLSANYLKSRLPQEGKPLNINELNQSLARLDNDPLIAKIEAEISQQSLGKNVLVVNLEEQNPWAAQLVFTNAYSPSIGGIGGNAQVVHHNFLGWSDRLSLNFSYTEGLRRIGGAYSFLFNSKDGRITFSYNNAENQFIEDVLENLGIKADYQSLELSIEQPIIINQYESLILGFGFEHIDSETFVLDDFSYSFVEGLEDGLSQITVLNFWQEYVRNRENSHLTTRSQFNVGIDAFDTTKNPIGIDGIFWSWQGEFQYLKAFLSEKDALFATRIFGQITTDQLLTIKQFTLGGSSQVRAYRPSLGVADNGVIGIVEIQLPLIKAHNFGKISIVPFFDVGTIWNNKRETVGTTNTLASAGLGLSYRLQDFFEARINYAIPLIKARGFGKTDTQEEFTVFLLLRPFNF